MHMRLPKALGSFVLLASGALLAAVSQPACDAPCEAIPTCSADEVEVAECAVGDGSCREVEECGSTIFCSTAETCEAYPSCGAGQVEVTECPATRTCESVSLCGSTILCMDTGPCTSSDECAIDEFCSFRDGECGAGGVGECELRPAACSDGPTVCFCDGTISDLGCGGLNGSDLDSTGAACTPPATAIACAHLICDQGTTDYCSITPDDTGGRPSASCGSATGCDPATCACLTAETTACSGTCTDSMNGPTVSCPGG